MRNDYYIGRGGYNTVAEQLNDSLNREPQRIVILSNNLEFDVVFRRNAGRNSTRNNASIFYPRYSPLKQGDTVYFRDKFWIVLNQEELSSDAYLRSDITQCNTLLESIINRTTGAAPLFADLIAINCFANDMQSLAVINGSVVSVEGGRINLIAEDNASSRLVSIGNTFWIAGMFMGCVGVYYLNGLAYMAFEATQQSATETLTPRLEANLHSFHEGYEYDISDLFTPVVNVATSSTSIDYIINNATLHIVSSDPELFDWDSEINKWVAKAEGHVELTCTWLEYGITKSVGFDIVPFEPKEGYVIFEFTGLAEIRSGATRALTAIFFDGDDNNITNESAITWTVSTTHATMAVVQSTANPSANQTTWSITAPPNVITLRPNGGVGSDLIAVATMNHPTHGTITSEQRFLIRPLF